MMRAPSRATKVRITAVMLALLPQVLIAFLFLYGSRPRQDEPTTELVFFSLWPPAVIEQPVEEQKSPVLRSPQTPSPALQPKALPQSEAPSIESTNPSESLKPSIDWNAEAIAAAGRQAAPKGPVEFSPPPKGMRKPCEKQKSSWEWNRESKKAGLLPVPYVTLGRCVVGLGFFGCALQKPPEANSHLLDDMRDGKTSPSSVPDPDICD